MENESLHPLLLRAVENAMTEQKTNVWKMPDIVFASVRNLELDSRGKAGENFIAEVLVALGHSVVNTERTDPQNKQWDLVVDDKHRWEVKTATLGGSGRNFQHENIYHDRAYHGIIFLDIAPNDLFVSFVPKHSIPWDKLHRRRDSIFYKWDFNLASLGAPTKTVAEFGQAYDKAVADIDSFLSRQRESHQI